MLYYRPSFLPFSKMQPHLGYFFSSVIDGYAQLFWPLGGLYSAYQALCPSMFMVPFKFELLILRLMLLRPLFGYLIKEE